MVNNGASGACLACKQRRKKCDESRPSCLRCGRAHRHCPGYELSKERKFVIYTQNPTSQSSHQQSAKLFHQISETSHLDPLDWDSIERDARMEFFKDFCIDSTDRDLSRGYLHGFQTMIAKAGPNSELERACTIIALSNLGRKLENRSYTKRAESAYYSLLRSFRLSISNEAVFTTVESLMTATLLGLYEIMTSTLDNPSAYVGHARGVSAIIVSKYSPFDLICGGKLFQLAKPLPLENLEVMVSGIFPVKKISRPFSVLCTPVLKQSICNTTIDVMHTEMEPLLKRAEVLLGSSDATLDQLLSLKLEAEHSRDAYNSWAESLPEKWALKSVGVIAPTNDRTTPDVGYWPGNIESYFDPYIASTTNSYRKIALLAMNIIIRCQSQIGRLTGGPEVDTAAQKYAADLTQSILSSIPYLLSADLQAFIKNVPAKSLLIPGRTVGGLLLIHGLFLLSTLPIVGPEVKDYLKDCLIWIGDHMGIGQATVLSKYTTMDQFEYSAEARVIIWTGMLI